MAKSTTEKLNKCLEFITNYISVHNYPPTVREICMALKVKSSATAQYYLKQLEKNGKIKRTDGNSRSIEIIGKLNYLPNENVTSVPLVGTVAAGTPILATENIEGNLSVPKEMFSENLELFATTVKGDSMINAGIFSGDKIIVKKQFTAVNGEVVVALIDDSATVKRFYKESNYIRLQPENDFYEPIIVKDCTILGVVVGLIRKF